MPQADEVEFYGDLRRETDLAFLFSDGLNEFWIPKSQIVEYDPVTEITYRVVIPEWLAKKKEII